VRPRPRRIPRAALSLAVSLSVLVPVLAGCGDAGGLRSAGPARPATGPVQLWPDLPPVTAPPYDYGETDTAVLPGVKVPERGVRGLDPVAVVKAEAEAFPTSHIGPGGEMRDLRRTLKPCRGGAAAGAKPGAGAATAPGTGAGGAGCPVLRPYYYDLTGDGLEELIVGIRLPEQQTEVRCYMPGTGADRGKLTRIMSTYDQLVSVELADRSIVLRSVSAGIPGFEYRTAWSWNSRHRTMLPTRDEIVRVDGHRERAGSPGGGSGGPDGARTPGSGQGSGPGTGDGDGQP
jgi:hypothetical protein